MLSLKKFAFVCLLSLCFILTLSGCSLSNIQQAKEKDQKTIQYEEEVIPLHKSTIDFNDFDDALLSLPPERYNKLEELILDRPLSVLQEHIKQGDFTCYEQVLFYLKRIKEHNEDYNAVIELNPYVLTEAKALDKIYAETQVSGDLLGAVILVKDNIGVKNTHTTAGAYALKDVITTEDAFLIKSIKNASGIILGKTNLSEWANFMSDPSSNGFSVLGGQTKNPYGKFDVGGSSSGSGVATALNFCTFAIGTETCGSLVSPSTQNSVATLKPTAGLLSRDLIIPITPAQDTAGYMARSVADIYMAMKATVAYDDKDSLGENNLNFDFKDFNTTLSLEALKGKRIGVDLQDCVEGLRVREELLQLGAELIDVTIDDSSIDIDVMPVYYRDLNKYVDEFLNNPSVQSPQKSLKDVVEYNKEDIANRAPYGQVLLQNSVDFEIEHLAYNNRMIKNRDNTRKVIDDILKEHSLDALVSFGNDHSLLYAPALYPAVNVPAGYKTSGEPIGITFVGTLYSDVKLMDLAYAYEMGTRHRVSPPLK